MVGLEGKERSLLTLSRTVKQVVENDYLATLHRIKTRYLPGGDQTDYGKLNLNLKRLGDCSEDQFVLAFKELDDETYQIIELWVQWAAIFERNTDSTKMIAYTPGTMDWEMDLVRGVGEIEPNISINEVIRVYGVYLARRLG